MLPARPAMQRLPRIRVDEPELCRWNLVSRNDRSVLKTLQIDPRWGRTGRPARSVLFVRKRLYDSPPNRRASFRSEASSLRRHQS